MERKKKLSFADYLETKGIMDKAVYEAIGMHRDTFHKRKQAPGSFTWDQIQALSNYLEIPIEDFIKRFLQ